MKKFTDIVKKYLPNAGVGANFESGDYVSQSWKWYENSRCNVCLLAWQNPKPPWID
jgi:hypothetical protein